MIRWGSAIFVSLGLGAFAACGSHGPKKPNLLDPDEAALDAKPDRAALADDLEMTIRESYRAISGGYDEAYLDGLSRDPRLVMLEVGPSPLVGYDPAVCALRRQYEERVEFVSKRLNVHISLDGSVGWADDELSYRVYHNGRRAIIPLRATDVFEMRAGKWLVTQEHVSYGIPDDEAAAETAAGKAAVPQPLDEYTSPGDAAKEVHDLLLRLVADADDTRTDHVSIEDGTIMIGVDPDRVLTGKELSAASTIRALYGYSAKVSAHDLRVKLSATGTVAWAAANVSVETTHDEKPITLQLRATWVVEKNEKNVWRVMQTHVSMPICRDELAVRAFGDTSPDKDTTAGCSGGQVAASSGSPEGADADDPRAGSNERAMIAGSDR
jgi:ketosteroid isomerase-like protein